MSRTKLAAGPGASAPKGLVRSEELERQGISRSELQRLRERGVVRTRLHEAF